MPSASLPRRRPVSSNGRSILAALRIAAAARARGYHPEADRNLDVAVKEEGPALFEPLAGPQRLAYDAMADITGYGGAAGGGKSLLEIGLAVTRHRRSIIFRREA